MAQPIIMLLKTVHFGVDLCLSREALSCYNLVKEADLKMDPLRAELLGTLLYYTLVFGTSLLDFL